MVSILPIKLPFALTTVVPEVVVIVVLETVFPLVSVFMCLI